MKTSCLAKVVLKAEFRKYSSTSGEIQCYPPLNLGMSFSGRWGRDRSLYSSHKQNLGCMLCPGINPATLHSELACSQTWRTHRRLTCKPYGKQRLRNWLGPGCLCQSCAITLSVCALFFPKKAPPRGCQQLRGVWPCFF